RLLLAAADLDPTWLRLLGLRHVHLEHTVAVIGLDLILAHALWQADRPAEGAEAPFEAVELVIGDLLCALALRRDGKSAVLELDRDLVLGNAGEIECVDDLL